MKVDEAKTEDMPIKTVEDVMENDSANPVSDEADTLIISDVSDGPIGDDNDDISDDSDHVDDDSDDVEDNGDEVDDEDDDVDDEDDEELVYHYVVYDQEPDNDEQITEFYSSDELPDDVIEKILANDPDV